MCGISGIFIEVSYFETNILDHFEKIIKSNHKNGTEDLYNDINKIFKNECLYFEYFSNKKFQIKFDLKKKQLLKKIKSLNFNNEDLIFTIENEFEDKIKFIRKYTNGNNISFNNISFLFNLSFIVNSINLIEIRGRDSLGLSLKIYIKDNKKKILNSKNLININRFKGYCEISYLFKTYNLVGEIGDNSSNIIKQIFEDKSLLNLFSDKSDIVNLFFHAHTRWASKGKINIGNCHPIKNFSKKNTLNQKIQISVNGDITNSESLTRIKSYMNNKTCTSDTLGFINLLSSQNILDNKLLKKQLIRVDGSYCFVIENLSNSKIFIGRSGNQGLYISYTKNKFIFSSDIYGFIEISNNYISIPNGFFYELNIGFNNVKSYIFEKFQINDLPKFLNVNKDKFSQSPIGFKDVYKGKYKHYFLKELIETKDVVSKTFDNFNYSNKEFEIFLNSQNCKINKSHFTNITKNYEDIIITGMGTCYTAAVAISQALRSSLRDNGILINVEPHIASEGSAFYIKEDMSKTLVIVIAQSGTTIDTNIYVELASKRGAKTLALVNKRDGDLTFIVDSVMYIGDGRDIEISVPSTKTYIAHIFLAEIFSIYLLKINNYLSPKNELFRLNLLKIKKNLITKLVYEVIKINIKNKILNEFLKRKNWVIAYNDYKSEALAQEIRIKFSESCYTVIPILSLDFIIETKYENTLIILVDGRNNKQKVKNLNLNNFIIKLGGCNEPNISYHIPINKKYDQIYEYSVVIYGQFLSYLVAKQINDRSKLFNKKGGHYFLKNKKNLNLFNKGYSKKELKNIINNIISKKIVNKTIRPIDTIKHQAKTITVGATRNSFNNKKFFSIKNINKYENADSKYKNTIYIHFPNGDETNSNFFINFLNSFEVNKYIGTQFKILKFYDSKYYLKKKRKHILTINEDGNKNIVIVNFKNKIIKYPLIKLHENKAISYKLNLMSLAEILKNLFSNKINLKNNIEKLNLSHLKLIQSIRKEFKNINFKKIYNLILNNDDIKFIGSGSNYNLSKESALNINKKFKKNIAWDVLENHKHIDISSEPLLFVFISNIKNLGYQIDALTEIEKFISHNNKVILFTSKSDKRFIKINGITEIVYLPDTTEAINQIILSIMIEELIKYY